MESLNPYINFNGRCREALGFYADCLGGKVEAMMTWAEGPGDMADNLSAEDAGKVMHAEFRAGHVFLMATDGFPGNEVIQGNWIQLCLHFRDEDEQTRVFEALAVDGQVTEPLAYAFWGDRFGMLTDRFGVRWMFVCPKQAS